MKKTVYLVGEKYDLTKLTHDDVEKSIQTNLDNWTLPGLIKAKVIGGEGYLMLIIYRKYADIFKEAFPFDGESMISCVDSDLLLGRVDGNVELPVKPPSVPFGYLYRYDIAEFIKVYKKNCKALGANVPKRIKVVLNSSYVAMILA